MFRRIFNALAIEAGLTPNARAARAWPIFLTKSLNEIFSTTYTLGVYERRILAYGYINLKIKYANGYFYYQKYDANG
jgi:hypothetical protein